MGEVPPVPAPIEKTVSRAKRGTVVYLVWSQSAAAGSFVPLGIRDRAGRVLGTSP